jgi:hypothetical protein
LQKLLAHTLKEYDLNGLGNGPSIGLLPKKNKTSKLKARIENIDEMGKLTLRFNMPVYIINNLTIIDETAIKLDIVNNANYRSRNLNFTWYAINMTERDLFIKLKFFEPRSISIYLVRLFHELKYYRFEMI